MDGLRNAILEALASDGSIPVARVREWIREPATISTDVLLYKLTRDAWHRIEPHLNTDETCAVIQRYLLGCIREDPSEDGALSRYEAAHELEAWLDHLAGLEHTREIVLALVDAVTTQFLAGDSGVRRALETGFLEHVLEQPSRRALFSHWAHDERLQEAWRLSLAWGEAHPNFTKSMRSYVSSAASDESE
jgi:hypothetical protein